MIKDDKELPLFYPDYNKNLPSWEYFWNVWKFYIIIEKTIFLRFFYCLIFLLGFEYSSSNVCKGSDRRD